MLVVAGAPEAAPPTGTRGRVPPLAAEGLTRREAVKETARRLGLPARDVYALVQDGEKS